MGYRILIVDDSSIVRRSLKKCLGLANIEVEQVFEAENGKEGLEILNKKWVDLVFLDINMPVMNGIEFMQRMREERKLDTVPVIVVSTEGSKNRQKELFAKDIKAFVRKPITPEKLAEVLEKAMEEVSR